MVNRMNCAGGAAQLLSSAEDHPSIITDIYISLLKYMVVIVSLTIHSACCSLRVTGIAKNLLITKENFRNPDVSACLRVVCIPIRC